MEAHLSNFAPSTTAASGPSVSEASAQVAQEVARPSCAGCGNPSDGKACAVCLAAASFDRSLCGLQHDAVFSFDDHLRPDVAGPTTVMYDLGVCLITKNMRQKMNRLIARPAYPFLLDKPPCNDDLAATVPLGVAPNRPAQPGPAAPSSMSIPVLNDQTHPATGAKVAGTGQHRSDGAAVADDGSGQGASPSRSQLQQSSPSHTARTFQCPECGKGFAQKAHLAVHTSVHTGATHQNHECQICYKRFSAGHMKAHAELHARNSDPPVPQEMTSATATASPKKSTGDGAATSVLTSRAQLTPPWER